MIQIPEKNKKKAEFSFFGQLSWSSDSRYLLINYRTFVILYHVQTKIGVSLDFLKKTKFTTFHSTYPNWILYVTRTIDTSDTIVVYNLGRPQVMNSPHKPGRLGEYGDPQCHCIGPLAFIHILGRWL